MHGITALMTGLLAAGLVTTAGAMLAVVGRAAGIEHRLGTAALSRLSVGALKFIGANDAMIACWVRAPSFVSIGEMVLVSLVAVAARPRAAHSAHIDGAMQ